MENIKNENTDISIEKEGDYYFISYSTPVVSPFGNEYIEYDISTKEINDYLDAKTNALGTLTCINTLNYYDLECISDNLWKHFDSRDWANYFCERDFAQADEDDDEFEYGTPEISDIIGDLKYNLSNVINSVETLQKMDIINMSELDGRLLNDVITLLNKLKGMDV